MDARRDFGTIARVEAAGRLYQQRHGKLPPGKDVAMTASDSETQEERRDQYDAWIAVHAYMDALNRICQLEERLEIVGGDDAVICMAAHVNNVLTIVSQIPERWRSDMDKAIVSDAQTALKAHGTFDSEC